MNARQQGKLVVVSGPSGAGKTTVLKTLFEKCTLPLRWSVSATTRSPRPGERDGAEYHFLTPDQFARRRDAGEFLECFEVFDSGCWYGTVREEVSSGLSLGNWVVLEIDVQGTVAVLEHYPEAITVFLRPSSTAELERRLRGRGTESEDRIQRRLEIARHELTFAKRYKHEVINQSVDQAAEDIIQILMHYAEHNRKETEPKCLKT